MSGAVRGHGRRGLSGGAIALVRLYQRAAPVRLRGSCRFTPSCSEYTIRSIEQHGVVAGTARGIARIRRCRPPAGGVDEP